MVLAWVSSTRTGIWLLSLFSSGGDGSSERSSSRPSAQIGRPTSGTTPGMSALGLEEGVVCHTYSADTRGLDSGSTARHAGATKTGFWIRRRDEYDRESQPNSTSKDCCA